MAEKTGSMLSPVHAVKTLLLLACLILFAVLGFSPGAIGTNKYGPDPYANEKNEALP